MFEFKPEYLELLPKEFSFGLLSGLAIGIFARWAVRFLAYAAIVVAVLYAFRDVGIL